MTTRRLIDRIVRSVDIPGDPREAHRVLTDAEWILTNGIGGYSSGTVAGVMTRRYHGLLVAALPNPLGRTMMLNHLGERLRFGDGTSMRLGPDEPSDSEGAGEIAAFRLVAGLPLWVYRRGSVCIEKRILMPHRQNTVHVSYRLVPEGGEEDVTLELSPAVHFRGHEEPVASMHDLPGQRRYTMSASAGLHRIAVDDDVPPLALRIHAAEPTFVADERITDEFLYPVEEDRGYEFRGTLWAPGHFILALPPGQWVTVIASAENEEVMDALTPDDAFRHEMERRRRLVRAAAPSVHSETGAELVLAADQFVISPAGRVRDTVRQAAQGDEIRTVIAGYHWFTDWGRDTMISLEGLTLTTGRVREASYILRMFADHVRDGLIPNLFPDGSNEGLYHTADATLWMFHAVNRYRQHSGDEETLFELLPVLVDVVEHHLRGTDFGIGVDPADGLLRQGAPGYQLTWMDAKVGDWVVTPRRGKPVEINALWYNALALLAGWMRELRGESAAGRYAEAAARARESFNRRFWMADAGHLYDVVDGEDGADSPQCRPNQILAVSLDCPVLEEARWRPVVDVVRDRLLTPVGLRSLAPDDPSYRRNYSGNLHARDAAYHQGTVWTWLIGPWMDAWLRVYPDRTDEARRMLDGCLAALGEFGLGTIGEIFDAEEPFTPRGCVAQAWSVAEVLRSYARLAGD